MPIFRDSTHKEDGETEDGCADGEHPYPIKPVGYYTKEYTDNGKDCDERRTSQDLIIEAEAIIIPFAIWCTVQCHCQASEERITLNT